MITLFNALNEQTFTVYGHKIMMDQLFVLKKQKNHDEKS